jgi:hypothetical protein
VPRKLQIQFAMAIGWVVFACVFFADGQKYKGSFAVMLAVGFLLVGIWPKVKARFRIGAPDAWHLEPSHLSYGVMKHSCPPPTRRNARQHHCPRLGFVFQRHFLHSRIFECRQRRAIVGVALLSRLLVFSVRDLYLGSPSIEASKVTVPLPVHSIHSIAIDGFVN